MRLKIGISPCPNDIFIFSGLILGKVEGPDCENPQWDFEFHDVETLNGLSQRGKLDLLKISYANYVFCSDQYALLNCGGALGRNCGPLLLTHAGVWDIQRPVYIPGEFTTANFLFDFFAGKAYKKIFLPFDELYEKLLSEKNSQGVVIHEKRFCYKDDGLNLIQDLGEYWELRTSYPIPLGGVVYKKSWNSQIQNFSQYCEALVRKSLHWARQNVSEALILCKEYSQSLSDEVIKAHIDLYVNDFSVDIGLEGTAAVEFFLKSQQNLRQALISRN